MQLPNYQITEQIYNGNRTIVYRGLCSDSRKPVVIKILKKDYPTFNEIVQFRNQYAITKNLDIPGIVKPIALEPYGNGLALVMKDDGSTSLSEELKTRKNKHCSLAEFFSIAIQITEILEGLSQNRIIHKDIKPANILIHPDTKQVKLIDFSISSLLPKEQQEIQNPNILEGTLAYISPEQTGRMNRGIDYRSDFYSVGVTFYELLTGKLPFESDDAMELVHCHIAKMPGELGRWGDGEMGRRATPQVLADIVMKLMAKNAEERYQSALGLKYDLEKCWQQWQETGAIEAFELGERDICDRFTIPEKLYGRESEVRALLNAFERVATGNSEMMLVAGFSGIGKTAVVKEVHKPIVRQRGYFIKGKFDQFNRNIPFSAFVQAFRDLMGQLLGELDTNLTTWKTHILDALGDNAQVIIDVVPELEGIIGKQPSVPELSGSAAQNRFNLLLGKFVRVFTAKEHPLVIFLDDLQWADSASLNLLKLLMDESEASYLLVLGAYRDNEVFAAHPLMLTLDEIEKQGANLNTLTLATLDRIDITRLVADTLLCSTEIAAPLSGLIYQKTQGNPFFTTQFLQGLHEEGCITFNFDVGYWQCDLVRVRQLALTEDVVAFMVGRLRKLPETTQGALKLAACIGNQFDLATLAVVCEVTQEEVATDLWRGLLEGFVVPESETYKFFQGDNCQEKGIDNITVGYRFLHDRVQQAAYALIPERQKQVTHFKVGQLLVENLSPQEQDEKIFEIVNQLNYGVELISNLAQKEQLIRLNLRAARRAKASTAYGAAVKYCAVGRGVFGAEGWQSAYELTLALYEESAEVAYLNTDFEQTQQFSDVVIREAKTLLDRVNIYATIIQSNIAQVKLVEAVDIARTALKLIDNTIDLPEHVNESYFAKILAHTRRNLDGRSMEDLLNIPEMSTPERLAEIRILASVAPPAYFAIPSLLPAIAMKMVNLSIEFGNTSSSAFGYAMYSFILCGIVNDIESGYPFGQLALDLVNKFDARDIKAKVLLLAGNFINPWRESVSKSFALLPEAYQVGLESGDLEFAGYSASFYCFHSIFFQNNLEVLERTCTDYGEAIAKIKQEHVLPQIHIAHQTILNLLESSECPYDLIGNIYNEREAIPLHEKANNRTTLAFVYVVKLALCYLFENYRQGIKIATRAEEYLDGAVAMLCIVLFYFYDSLAQLTQFLNANPMEKNQILERVRQSQIKMKYWADCAPINYQHKYDLVEAERHRVLGEKLEAIELYDRAISGAQENEYLQEEALANELAAKFYLHWSKEKIAQTYMLEAYYCYVRWGAKAKIDHLEATYPQLLAPILQQPKSSLTLNATTTLNSHQTIHTSTNNSTSLLDISAAIKASQALSSEIELEALLSQLMQIVLENAGADKGVLVLNNHETWEVVAQCQQESCQLCFTSLNQADVLPLSLVLTVQRTQQAIILNQVEKDTYFAGDSYLIIQQPKSLCCIPIVNQNKLIGILYLENNLSIEAFTSERLEILTMLTSQAAISLENAQLYQQLEAYSQTLEEKVEQRTSELKAAQQQLISQEKLASLGALTAGVAHELRNPLNFVTNYAEGSVEMGKELIEDFQEHKCLNEEDWEYVQETIIDLKDNAAAIHKHSQRAESIIYNMMQHSRSDDSSRQLTDINKLLDEARQLAYHSKRSQDNSFNITFTTEYDESVGELEVFSASLSRAFINLIDNGCYAAWKNHLENGQKVSPQLWITTKNLEKEIEMRIRDNGRGIPDDFQEKIFEPFFTTKPTGEGTGLGLSLTHEIIVGQHGGTLQMKTEPGSFTEFILTLPKN